MSRWNSSDFNLLGHVRSRDPRIANLVRDFRLVLIRSEIFKFFIDLVFSQSQSVPVPEFRNFLVLVLLVPSVDPWLGHLYMQIALTRNSEKAISQMKNGEYSAIFGATVSVDSFFCIGGLLLAYLSTDKILKSFNTFRRHMLQ